jgi:DNA-binding protein HU-beta
MTRNDVVQKVSEKTGIDPMVCKQVFEATIETLRQSIVDQKPVFIRGLGTFKVVQRAAKTCRDISRGTTMVKPACKKPVFKPSPSLVTDVNDNDY